MTTFSAGEMFGASKHWTCNWKNAQGVEVQKGVDAASAHDAALLIRRMYDVPSTTQVNVAEYSRATLAKGPYQTFDNSDADPTVRAKAAAFAKSLKPSSREADMTTIRVPRPNAGKADITVKPSTEDGQGERIPGRFGSGEMFAGQSIFDNLPVGLEIYYTGDMANQSSFGKIIEIIPEGKYGGKAYKIQFEDGHKSIIGPSSFYPGPGRRFMPKSEYKLDRERKIAKMQEDASKRQGGYSSGEMFGSPVLDNATAERLKGECFGVTGPTRMQIQQAYESEKSAGATERDAVRKIEARFGISGVVVNQSGDVVSWQGEANFAAECFVSPIFADPREAVKYWRAIVDDPHMPATVKAIASKELLAVEKKLDAGTSDVFVSPGDAQPDGFAAGEMFAVDRQWQILGSSGMMLGMFPGVTAVGALNALAEKRGFRSWAEMCKEWNLNPEYETIGSKILTK